MACDLATDRDACLAHRTRPVPPREYEGFPFLWDGDPCRNCRTGIKRAREQAVPEDEGRPCRKCGAMMPPTRKEALCSWCRSHKKGKRCSCGAVIADSSRMCRPCAEGKRVASPEVEDRISADVAAARAAGWSARNAADGSSTRSAS